jgi:hypothetical protein
MSPKTGLNATQRDANFPTPPHRPLVRKAGNSSGDSLDPDFPRRMQGTSLAHFPLSTDCLRFTAVLGEMQWLRHGLTAGGPGIHTVARLRAGS